MKRGILFLIALAVTTAAPVYEERHNQSARAIPNYPGIQFGADGRLSISVFSDLHFGEPSGDHNDAKTTSVMNSVLDNENSNLVVLNGDLISCEFVNPDQYNRIIDQIVSPLVNRNLLFGVAFGNHDSSETCSTVSMSQHMWWDVKGTNSMKLSFTTQSVEGPVEEVGWSNYYIPVYSSSDSNKLAMLLWFFDSRGGRVFQPGKNLNIPIDGYVNQKVVSWFRSTRDQFKIQNGRVIPSLAFVHIPVQATRAFQRSGRLGENTEPGLNTEEISHEDDCPGSDCYNYRDYDFMEALAETEGLMAVFSGHDHGIDWCMKWGEGLPTGPSNGNGVHLCFNRHSGFGGYSQWKRGARLIQIDEKKLGKNELDTWIRLEDGSISGAVTLNATYGSDHYPEVEHLASSGWWEWSKRAVAGVK